ncbi:unnamed protein product [Arabis nemorensis]|uniref:Uncharacterized protein n=1 Tax=Arabis nemorensis TaxID=586526 RepID=A0A565BIU1_9BRAS|nr:unnamed protein product [Arabis nemorensis]
MTDAEGKKTLARKELGIMTYEEELDPVDPAAPAEEGGSAILRMSSPGGRGRSRFDLRDTPDL